MDRKLGTKQFLEQACGVRIIQRTFVQKGFVYSNYVIRSLKSQLLYLRAQS